jgi:hypothetical protein
MHAEVSFRACRGGYGAVMRWQLRPPDTLEISLLEGAPPSREEVNSFLEDVKPLVGMVGLHALVLDGERIDRRRPLTYPEIAAPILYEAARSRTSANRTLRSWGPARRSPGLKW